MPNAYPRRHVLNAGPALAAGASGMIGTKMVARAAPGAYAVLVGLTTHVQNPAIVDKYSAEMVRLVKLPEVRARLYEQTLIPVGDDAESFARTLKNDMALSQQMATAAGIKPQ